MSANRIIKAILLFSSLTVSSAFSPSHSFVGQHRNPLEKKLPQQLQPSVASTFIRKNVDHSATQLNSVMEIIGTSPEPIHTAFSLATFGPQPFWLLLILLPKADITKKVMGTMGTCHRFTSFDVFSHGIIVDFMVSLLLVLDVVLFFALLHFFIVSGSIVQPGATAPLLEFSEVFNPNGDPQAAFMNMVTNYPNFVAEGKSVSFCRRSPSSYNVFD
jgi:hypothetical protein